MKIKLSGAIYVRKCEYTQVVSFVFFSFKPEGYVYVCDHQIEIEIPEGFSLESSLIEKLKEDKEDATIAFHKKISELNEKISKLQCLEML